MELLIAVIEDPECVEEILAGFLDIGVTGATIVSSEGMGRMLSGEMPAFSSLQSLIARARPRNQTLFSVIEDPSKVDRAVALVEKICGRFTAPSTGIVFTLPVNRAVGLAPELKRVDT